MARKKVMVKGTICGHSVRIPREAAFDIFWGLQSHKCELVEELAVYKRNADGSRNEKWLENEIEKYEYLSSCFRNMY